MKTNMIIKTFLIAGGNSTLLVQNCEKNTRKQLISQYLGKVEQVGFIQGNRLEMMGSELCINGTIAFASQLSEKKGKLFTSGIGTAIKYFNTDAQTTIELPITTTLDKNIVLLPGIGFLCETKDINITKELLLNFCQLYDLPAFGVAIYKDNQLTPYVYVKKTDSLFKETACGSGSIAICLFTGLQQIRQPTGEYISVRIEENTIAISAQVKEVKNYDILQKGNTMSTKQLPQPLKGFRDFLPDEARKRRWLKEKITKVFELWGFDPLETPTLEPLELFSGQIGEDEKLFFKFKDSGDRDVALRYDQTVPACRVVAQYYQQLPMPFKRYQIQPAFRAEKPQKGRYREFVQCDADIFGVSSPIADAEVIALSLDIYRKIGFPKAKVLINDRQLLKDLPYDAIVAIDKLKKIGKDGVIEDMKAKGISIEDAQKYLNIVLNLKPNETISIILNYLKEQGFDPAWYEFDPTIARSFSYSSGPIWEIEIPGIKGSVLGGERFDNLIEKIAGFKIPATGFGLGFDRTLEAAEELGLLPQLKATAKVLVTVFSKKLLSESLKVASILRDLDVATEVYTETEDKLSKQFKYASKKGTPWTIVIGPEEIEKKVVQLKNMQTGEQQQVSQEKLVNLLSA